jgi:hypothetical protein
MKTGVRLLGTCHRLLRAVLMIKWSDDKSGMVIGAAVYVLSGGSASRTAFVLGMLDFPAVSRLRSAV